jgi:pimeloyl-ACP methyl ester carboxylesterase
LQFFSKCKGLEADGMTETAAPTETSCLVRPEGRRIGVAEYGAPQGLPLFYAHGTPGSRLEGRHFHDTARRSGIRLICLDRPGIGQSDFAPHYNLLDYPRDLVFVADQFGIDGFGVLGWSSGGPHTLTCGLEIPERLRCLVVLASYTNFGEYAPAQALLWEHDQLAPAIAVKSQVLFRALLTLLRFAERHAPLLYLAFIKRSSTARDVAILERTDVYSHFMTNQDEAFQQGVNGILRDLYIEYIDWGYRLEEVHYPVQVFQGREDRFVPWQFAAHLAQSLPQAEVHYLEQQGHLFPLDSAWQQQLWTLVRTCWRCPFPVSHPTPVNGARTQG